MRENKFRAWDKTNNEWFMNGDCFDLNHSGKYGIFLFDNDHPQHMRDSELVWVQYTGLKDKNWKEIFEGDILKALHSEYEEVWIKPVEYKDCCFTIGRYWKDGIHDWYSMEQFESFEIEVIGNIYENPELLPDPAGDI